MKREREKAKNLLLEHTYIIGSRIECITNKQKNDDDVKKFFGKFTWLKVLKEKKIFPAKEKIEWNFFSSFDHQIIKWWWKKNEIFFCKEIQSKKMENHNRSSSRLSSISHHHHHQILISSKKENRNKNDNIIPQTQKVSTYVLSIDGVCVCLCTWYYR